MTPRQIRAAWPKVLRLEAKLVDRGYERRIDALIPEAVKYANEQVALWVTPGDFLPENESAFKDETFDYYFHTKMNELARAEGLRS